MYVCARRENARGLKILLRRRIFSKAVAKCWADRIIEMHSAAARGFLSFCALGFDFALPPTKKKTRQQHFVRKIEHFCHRRRRNFFFFHRAANGPLLQCVIISLERVAALRKYARNLSCSARTHRIALC